MNKYLFKVFSLIFALLFAFSENVFPVNSYYAYDTKTIKVGESVVLSLPNDILGLLPATNFTYKWTLGSDAYDYIEKTSSNGYSCTVRGKRETYNAVRVNFSGSFYKGGLIEYEGYYLIKVSNTVLVESISLNYMFHNLTIGSTLQLVATVKPDNAADKSVTWYSEDPDVASVDQNGLVTALKTNDRGGTYIHCKTNDRSNLDISCGIGVNPKPILVEEIVLEETSLTLYEGETKKFVATVKPDNAADKKVIWESSNENVAKFDSWGNLTAKSVGTTTVTCKANDGSGVTASCEVTVKEKRNGKFTAKTPEGVEMAFYGSTYNGTCYVTNPAINTDYSGKITIPEEVNGLKVVCIGHDAFQNCKGITEVSIPNSVETIEQWAFYGCESLKSVTIPDNVTKIGVTAFAYCTSLESVTLGKGITKIEGSMFHSCTALTTISGLEQIIYVGYNAFLNTPWLANQPDGLVYVGKALVKYNGTMPENSTITIKEGTTMIGGRAFESQSNLVGISIPESVTSIGGSAFSFCKNLRSIVIPKQVTEIESFAFSYCTGLRNIVSRIEEPMAIEKYVFNSNPDSYIYENATLYVPKGTKGLYQQTEVWNQFKNIVEGEPTSETGINSLSVSQPIDGCYTIDGRKLEALPTKKGIYVINGQKIVVK